MKNVNSLDMDAVAKTLLDLRFEKAENVPRTADAVRRFLGSRGLSISSDINIRMEEHQDPTPEFKELGVQLPPRTGKAYCFSFCRIIGHASIGGDAIQCTKICFVF